MKSFTRLDIFGKAITLTFEGKDTFQTSVGAFFTVLCVVSTLSYGVGGLMQVLQGTILSLTTQQVFSDASLSSSGFNPAALGF
jgi:hypothetical protein